MYITAFRKLKHTNRVSITYSALWIRKWYNYISNNKKDVWA